MKSSQSITKELRIEITKCEWGTPTRRLFSVGWTPTREVIQICADNGAEVFERIFGVEPDIGRFDAVLTADAAVMLAYLTVTNVAVIIGDKVVYHHVRENGDGIPIFYSGEVTL